MEVSAAQLGGKLELNYNRMASLAGFGSPFHPRTLRPKRSAAAPAR